MKSNKLTVIISFITMILVLVVMCTFQLKVDKVAILTTFGTPKVISKPGLYFRFPWPIEKLVKLDKRKQLLLMNERQTLTKDDINLIVKVFVAWSVADGDENALTFYKKLGESPEKAETDLRGLVASKQEMVIRKYKLSDFLSATGDGTKNEQIEKDLKVAIDSKAKEYGISVHKVSISRLSLHEKNSVSVLAKMQQGQLRKSIEISSKALKESKIKKNSANEKAEKLLAKAEAEAKKIRSVVLAKSADLFAKYEKDQDFALFLRKLDAIRETTKSKTTFFINPDIPPFDLFRKSENKKGEK
jgi:regulator of protease activity HflC (stomatin/prohibitin superfamily)